MGVIFALLLLGAIIVAFISWWKIFEKAGEAGWKSLVPFYNAFIDAKIYHLAFNESCVYRAKN